MRTTMRTTTDRAAARKAWTGGGLALRAALGLAVAAPTGASAQELLVNGDAEAVVLAPWSATSVVEIVASQVQTAGVVSPFEGSYFFTFASQPGAEGSMVQSGASGLVPGALVVLRGRVQVEFGDQAEARLRFLQNDAVVGSATTGPMAPPTGVWEPFELPATVPAGADRWEVEMRGSLVTGTFVNVFYDALSLAGCATSIGAAEVVRAGVPPNPSALLPGVTSPPKLGATWDPVVSHAAFAPTAVADLLGITPGPINVVLPGYGTLLCNPAVVLSVLTVPPGQPFHVPVPADCAFAGLTLCTQGASVLPGGAIQLTNALDVTLGTF